MHILRQYLCQWTMKIRQRMRKTHQSITMPMFIKPGNHKIDKYTVAVKWWSLWGNKQCNELVIDDKSVRFLSYTFPPKLITCNVSKYDLVLSSSAWWWQHFTVSDLKKALPRHNFTLSTPKLLYVSDCPAIDVDNLCFFPINVMAAILLYEPNKTGFNGMVFFLKLEKSFEVSNKIRGCGWRFTVCWRKRNCGVFRDGVWMWLLDPMTLTGPVKDETLSGTLLDGEILQFFAAGATHPPSPLL